MAQDSTSLEGTEGDSLPLLNNHIEGYYGSDNQVAIGEQDGIRDTELDDSSSKFDDEEDSESDWNKRSASFLKQRFWWFCALGLLAIIVLHLSFLPRTSFSRDFRRWHGLHLTKTDIKRNFLILSGLGNMHGGVSEEGKVDDWLRNFTDINSKQSVNLIASDNCNLATFVEENFKKFGLDTSSHTYRVSDLRRPLLSSIKLMDSETSKLVYNSNLFELDYKTPAFSVFGFNGTARGEYIYVNEGTLEDYRLLFAHDFSVKGKIVIVKSTINSNLSLAEKLLLAEKYGAIAFVVYSDLTAQNYLENGKGLSCAILRDSAAYGQIDDMKLSSIPSIPISLKSVKPILDTLANERKSAPFKEWDYYPETISNFEIELGSKFETHKSRKLINIVGCIKGVLSDGDIVIGARRDSITSSNPLSGHAILFEIMSNLQKLRKMGWKPLRGIKFISWDGSSSGLLGSQLMVNDTDVFKTNQPILGYINIDGDAVTGSKLSIDANPLFNHLLKDTAKLVPLPKKATNYKSLPDINKDDMTTEWSTLHRYWAKQDNNFINNILGEQLIASDALIFQNHFSSPIINVKFEHDPKRDSSIYIPNSNFYSYNWLIKRQVDNDLLLHTVLIRYLGLLLLSLSEHEVVDFKTYQYFSQIDSFFENLIKEHADIYNKWSSELVPHHLLDKSVILNDLKGDIKGSDSGDPIVFNQLIDRFTYLLEGLKEQSEAYDIYNKHIQETLIEDYPWYKFYKKLHVFAQLKISNYKLLHLERSFMLTPKDHQYLNYDKESYFNHVIYGVPKFSVNNKNDVKAQRLQWSVFTSLHQSAKENDYIQTVKLLVITYDKLESLYKKMA